jgi:glycosyltransferase involved in cell wall biosynthesis
MIKISIVTPVRENEMELDRALESIRQTTEVKEEIEIVIVIDKCDGVLLPKADSLMEKYKDLNLRIIKTERSEHFVRDYYNFASKNAQGRWILAINIDVMFMTPRWDRKIIEKMEAAATASGDDMLYGIVKDGLPREGDGDAHDGKKALWHKKVDFSCWILTSRQFVQFYGGMMDPANWLWGADHWTGLMWQAVLGGSRVVMIRDVFIDHISHHTKDLPQPPSFDRFCDIMRKHPIIYTQAMADREAIKIEDHIRSLHV